MKHLRLLESLLHYLFIRHVVKLQHIHNVWKRRNVVTSKTRLTNYSRIARPVRVAQYVLENCARTVSFSKEKIYFVYSLQQLRSLTYKYRYRWVLQESNISSWFKEFLFDPIYLYTHNTQYHPKYVLKILKWMHVW